MASTEDYEFRSERLDCDVDMAEGRDLGNLDMDDVEFTNFMLESMVGGSPHLGLSVFPGENGEPDRQGWIVVSSCECETCQDFRANNRPIAALTATRAAKRYVQARVHYHKQVLGRCEVSNDTRH